MIKYNLKPAQPVSWALFWRFDQSEAVNFPNSSSLSFFASKRSVWTGLNPTQSTNQYFIKPFFLFPKVLKKQNVIGCGILGATCEYKYSNCEFDQLTGWYSTLKAAWYLGLVCYILPVTRYISRIISVRGIHQTVDQSPMGRVWRVLLSQAGERHNMIVNSNSNY